MIKNPNQIKSATSNIGDFSTTNNDIRYRLVEGLEAVSDKEVFNTIKRESKEFLDNFGITLRQVEQEYKGELPLFDALNRVINFSSAEDITEGVGYAVAFMMQHNGTMQQLIRHRLGKKGATFEKDARRSIRKRGDFNPNIDKRALADHDVRDSILKEIGGDIASELRAMYNLETSPNTPQTLLKRLWSVIKEFFDMLTPQARLKFDVLSNYTKDIANSVRLNDPSIILTRNTKPGSASQIYRVDIERALRESPYEESIITKLNREGIALAGSASVALSGTVYRPSENPLHDIDFEAESFETKKQMDEVMNRLFPNNSHIRTIRQDNHHTETYLIMDRPFDTRRATSGISGKIIYDKETGEKLGSYVGSELVLKEGVKGKFLDFFLGKPKFPEHTVKVLNGVPYLISDFRNAWDAKVSWARPKDIWNFNRFVPNNFDYSVVEMRKEQERKRIKELLNSARVIWGHPAIGKTTYLERNQDILEWDEEVNERRNRFFRDQIDPEHKMDINSREYKQLRSNYMSSWRNHPEYIEFLTKEWNALLNRAKREGKRVFASPLPLLEMFADEMDLVVNIPENTFLQRNMQRGGTPLGSMGWKQSINRALMGIDSNKVVTTDKYFSDFMRDNLGVQWGTLTSEEVDYLTKKGWTEEQFARVSQVERDHAIECLSI